MLSNGVVLVISVVLALTCFVIPAIYKTSHRLIKMAVVASIYSGVFVEFVMLDKLNAGVAIIVLGAILAAVCEALIIDYELIDTAKYPKNRRCY